VAGLSDRRTRTVLLTLVVVVLLVNLPLVNSLRRSAEVRSDGVDVTARLVESRVLGEEGDPQYWVSYRLPEDVDPQARAWPAQVDRATYDRARQTGRVAVRVLPDDPAAAEVDGEVGRRAGLWSTLVVDAVLLGLLLLWWRHRRRREAAETGRPGPGDPGQDT
jgi:hypothetical protein